MFVSVSNPPDSSHHVTMGTSLPHAVFSILTSLRTVSGQCTRVTWCSRWSWSATAGRWDSPSPAPKRRSTPSSSPASQTVRPPHHCEDAADIVRRPAAGATRPGADTCLGLLLRIYVYNLRDWCSDQYLSCAAVVMDLWV